VPSGARVRGQVTGRFGRVIGTAVWSVAVAVEAIAWLPVAAEQPSHDQGGVEQVWLVRQIQPVPPLLLP